MRTSIAPGLERARPPTSPSAPLAALRRGLPRPRGGARLRGALLAGALLAPLVVGGAAMAQEETPRPQPVEVPEGFEPVPGGKPKTEEVNAALLVVLAYAAFALGFVGYLVYLARAQAALSEDIENLSARLDAADGGD